MDINLNPTILKIFSILNDNNLKAYLVGGVIRDLLIEKHHNLPIKNKDYDIEVFGVSLSDLENLLRTNLDSDITKEGESFSVLKVYTDESEDPIDIAIPRTEVTTGDKYTDFNITPDPSLTVEQASIRRDITINAIYYDPISKQINDPFNGVDDIKNKVIRAVSTKTFIEDPLRVLRVMQFAGRFGFEVAPETVNLCKKMVKDNMLQALSKDRVREEFLKFAYKTNYPALSLEFLKNVDLLKIYMPEISVLQETLQTPEWHPEGNVYNHSLQVINAGTDIANREGLSSYEKAILILSCLYHDSGKALATVFDEKEKVYRAHGHADKGVQLVLDFAQRINLPSYLVKSLPVLVKYHMHLPVLFYNHKNGQDQTKAFNRIALKLNNVGVDIKLLLWLVEADRRGRKPAVDGESYEPFPKAYLAEFMELEKWFSDMVEELQKSKILEKELITGEQILQVVKQKQGVWVGAVKEFIKDLYLTKKYTESKSRVELYTAEGQIQAFVIKQVYEFLEESVGENLPAMYPNKVRGTWKKVIEDEEYRDELLEEFI
ncbi:MAG: HD domain-containing protein [bacterium]|nr:HD domain-containing protein [bacterium]